MIERIASQILGNERRIWLQLPQAAAPSTLCLLLDGEYYVERMDAPAVLRAAEGEGKLPPLAVAFVSHVDAATRWPESFCNRDFARFVDEELLPWALSASGLPATADVLLGGLSLTGLAAAHAALHSPRVAGALCQSASFWWSDCRLARELPSPARPLCFRLSCGARETVERVEHGPELIQTTSQLASNRLMRDALRAAGHAVSYEEYDGGHDLACWRADLPGALQTLLAMVAAARPSGASTAATAGSRGS